ncbi:MAG: DUF2341 domain-containing protein [Verrucomicrobiota bacterium]
MPSPFSKLLAIPGLALLTLLHHASAQYPTWSHSAPLSIITTPDGANLPASASEENFPLLVRLNQPSFDFQTAQPHGADLRFSAAGQPLAYQIEEWNPTAGQATVWVRIPLIKGNAHQIIQLHWGNPQAKSESSGPAVFNESNGFVTVMHLDDPQNPQDAVGTLTPTNLGATSCPGMISKALNFVYGRPGVVGGEKITNYPTGNSPSTSELWFKDNKLPGPWGSRFLCWGVEGSGSKLLIGVLSPLHISCGLECPDPVALNQWYHVVHTYSPDGTQKAYVNGQLVASSKALMDFKSPCRMFVGNWYRNWESDGDVDEVRISKVTRSADWIRLCFQNQNPLQSLVGTPPPAGKVFAVSSPAVVVEEGKSVTITAQAGGAQKRFWILKRPDRETIVAVDQDSYTIHAGRVDADTSSVLQFKAITPEGVKTKDISITVKESIPNPVFTLQSPQNWNGRDLIAVIPVITNLPAIQAKGATDFHTTWTVSGGAVIQEITPDRLLLKRSQFSGPLTIRAVIDNGGSPQEVSTTLQVAEPETDPWIHRLPAKDEQPEDGQFFARDDQNHGTLHYNGSLNAPADSVFLKLYADDKLLQTFTAKPAADKSYALTAPLQPGLIKYKVEFGTQSGSTETLLRTVSDLVCGDAYLIDGQSNALATDTREKAPPETNQWIRSYGKPDARPKAGSPSGERLNLWCQPVWKATQGEQAELGYWGMELAKRLVASQKMPIFIINAAVGGSRIDQHQRNQKNPTDLTTIYGRMLWRVQQARLTDGIRAVIWHQGENNQGMAGPTGDYDWKSYQPYFTEMAAAWKEDFPNIQHYYLFQIWPGACSMGDGKMIREKQRSLSSLFSHLHVLPTLGIRPPGTCHYPLAGWAEFATLLQPLLERDFYGKKSPTSITPPNLQKASYTTATKDTIALEFDQPVVWLDALTAQFTLPGETNPIASGSASGKVITLHLKSPSQAKTISYPAPQWNQTDLIYNPNGITALTFGDVPISSNP